MNTISGKDCRQKRRGGAGRHESARRRRVGPERGVFVLVLVGGVSGCGGGDRRAYLRDRDGFEDRRNVMRRRGGRQGGATLFRGEGRHRADERVGGGRGVGGDCVGDNNAVREAAARRGGDGYAHARLVNAGAVGDRVDEHGLVRLRICEAQAGERDVAGNDRCRCRLGYRRDRRQWRRRRRRGRLRRGRRRRIRGRRKSSRPRRGVLDGCRRVLDGRRRRPRRGRCRRRPRRGRRRACEDVVVVEALAVEALDRERSRVTRVRCSGVRARVAVAAGVVLEVADRA